MEERTHGDRVIFVIGGDAATEDRAMKEHQRMIVSPAVERLTSSNVDYEVAMGVEVAAGRPASRAAERAARAVLARQASQRRRYVDPTTCERDYSQAELEFMNAIQAYKQQSGRMFPTWSEVLEVLKTLGYEKTE